MKRDEKTFRDNNLEACLTTKSTKNLTGGTDIQELGREMKLIFKSY